MTNIAPSAVHRYLDLRGLTPIDTHLQARVFDAPGDGGASSQYEVFITNATDVKRLENEQLAVTATDEVLAMITFQKGPPQNGASINGVTNETLLAIVLDCLDGFQSGPFACAQNAEAQEHLRKAIAALQGRTQERVDRGVEGQTVE